MKNASFYHALVLMPLLFSCASGGTTDSQTSSSSSEETSSENSGRYKFGKTITPVSLPDGEINKSEVGYEIFVGSFADSNGDGIGDLNGIKAHLDYLSSLGVTYLWLTPIHPSSTYHHYDVEDYFSVAKEFGTVEDFSSLCIEAKKRGMKVVLDMVLNHSSKKNPWFEAALDDFVTGYAGEDSYKDDYVFYSSLPANSSSKFYTVVHNGKTVYYEANFDSNMPEFNLSSEACKARQRQILEFWLNAGASGFRFDGVYYYFYKSNSDNVAYCKELRSFLASKKEDVYTVAEVWPNDFSGNTISSYSSSGMTLFDFMNSVTGPSTSSFVSFACDYKKAGVVFSEIEDVQSKQAEGTEPVFFLSNHDQDRIRSYFNKFKEDDSLRLMRRKLAASYCLLTPGTPFLYYGEEIDLGGTRGNANTDANRRLPFIWSEVDDSARCSNPIGADYSGDQQEKGAYDEEKDPNSLLSHYKALVALRGKYPFIKGGTYKRVSPLYQTDGETPIRTVGFGIITYEGKTYALVHNEEGEATFSLPELEGQSYSILDGVYPDGSLPSLSGRTLTVGPCSSTLLSLE